MLEIFSITPKTSLASIEYWGSLEVVLVLEPVPIRQRTSVPAVVAKCLFPEVNDIAMPCEKGACLALDLTQAKDVKVDYRSKEN